MDDQTSEGPLILPFSAIDASKLALVGGKAANLGELTRGGFPADGVAYGGGSLSTRNS